MQIVDSISRDDLGKMAATLFGNFVKGVVDIDKNILALDAELHSDLEAMLLESGSKQENLWGINLYPEISGGDFVEFDSMINVRPNQKNNSRGVEDESIREKIRTVVKGKIQL